LVHPTSGGIWFEGHRIDGFPPEKMVRMGTNISMEERRLFPSMTVFENLQMRAYSRRDVKKGEMKRNLEEIYEVFPILKEKMNCQARILK